MIIASRRIPVRARELQGDERTAALTRTMVYNKQWRSYANSLDRVLPVVRLEPADPGDR